MTTRYPNLPTHLKSFGLNVQTLPGWKNNGRPWSRSFKPKGVVCHHTASGAHSGNFASQGIVTHGRGSALPGPLCQFLLGRDGTVKIITGEGSNHAGTGGPISVLRRNLGNYDAWGIEAENSGTGEHWPEVQLQAYYRLCAALLDLMHTDDVHRVVGHKEYTSRKIDPNGINMNTFRSRVGAAKVGSGKASPSRAVVHLSNLHKGATNADVYKVKRALSRKGYKGINTKTSTWGIGATRAYAAFQRSLGYKGKEADGVPGHASLSKLGFNTV